MKIEQSTKVFRIIFRILFSISSIFIANEMDDGMRWKTRKKIFKNYSSRIILSHMICIQYVLLLILFLSYSKFSFVTIGNYLLVRMWTQVCRYFTNDFLISFYSYGLQDLLKIFSNSVANVSAYLYKRYDSKRPSCIWTFLHFTIVHFIFSISPDITWIYWKFSSHLFVTSFDNIEMSCYTT